MVKNHDKLKKKTQISRKILKKQSIILKNSKTTVKNIETPSNMSKKQPKFRKTINKPQKMARLLLANYQQTTKHVED